MPSPPISVPTQLQLVSELTVRCRRHQEESVQLNNQLEELKALQDTQLQDLENQLRRERNDQERQIQSQHDQQMDSLRLDTETRQQQLRAEYDGFVSELQKSAHAERRKLEEKRESELWLLQSVLDENVEDSPASRHDRERDVFGTQQAALSERLEHMGADLTAAELYLAACHAGVDSEYPVPAPQAGKRESLREAAHRECDLAADALHQVYRGLLPHWIRGARLWLLVGALFVVVWVPVMALQADLRQFMNPDIGNPNWRWAGVSALIAAAVSGLLGLILTMVCQNRLRVPFAAAQQHLSNAGQAMAAWQDKSKNYLDKLSDSATEWRRELEQQRNDRTAHIHHQIDQQVQQLQSQQEAELTRRTAILNDQLQQLNASHSAEAAQVEQLRQNQLTRLASQHDQEFNQRVAAMQSEFDHRIATLQTATHENYRQWQNDFQQLEQLSRESTASVIRTASWPVGEWKLPTEMPTFLPAGEWSTAVPEPTAPSSDEITRRAVHFPAVLRFPDDTSLVIEHDAAGRETALRFVRAQLLKLLTTIPAGRFRLTLIDPVGLGQSFSAMMHLADFDELLIHSRIWTESNQIRDQLQKVTEHMENIFQTYLRSQFSTIEEYNRSAGEVAEPYHFVVVAGFPTGFSDEGARHLASILSSGPRCGVYALVTWNPAVAVPPSFDIGDLQSNGIHFRVTDDTVQPTDTLPPPVRFTAAEEPPADQYIQMVRTIGEQSKDARRVEVSFNRIAPRPEALWSQSSVDGIDLPIGRAGAARLQFMRLGRGTSQHVLIAGKTGSGKSTFLHILITNLALHYGPQEVQFYLIDFKKGVEFKTYAQNRLPHARVIAIESDREFGLSVLERLDQILQERGELFRDRGVQDVPAFRRRFPDESMPRLLLLIDEFQEFFVAEDRVSSRASLLLDRLVRQGRAFGIHVLLGSQTLGGAYSLARSTMGQIAVRIALQCSENDAHLILSEDNSAARLLNRPGEAIYNDANGLVEGNHQFQIAWLDEDRREEAIDLMLQQRDEQREHGMIVFEGNVPPTAEFCAPMNVALTAPPDATQRSGDIVTCWLGEPVAIAGPTAVEFRRGSGQNLLVVGQDENQADSLLAFVLISTLQTVTQPAARVRVLMAERDRDAIQRFRDLSDTARLSGLTLEPTADSSSSITAVLEQIERRETAGPGGEDEPTVLIVRNIGQFRELRRDDNDFGLGGFGDSKPASIASQFADIIKRGPLVGIHVVVWADTFSNATRWLSTSLLREFENRVAFRMNQTDSASLVDSPVASSLSAGRALLYRDQTGTIEKFRPFAWPSDGWLQQLNSPASAVSDPEEFDIDSLRIE